MGTNRIMNFLPPPPPPRDGRPAVDLSWERVCCPKHLTVFHRSWPAGYASFSILAFQAVAESAEFKKETRLDVAQVGPALDRVPLCCRVSRDALVDLYVRAHEASPFLRSLLCECCGMVYLGVDYPTKSWVKPLCLVCIVNELRVE